jgi:DNA topoisomerase-3
MEPCKKESVVISATNSGHLFQASGTTILSPGWTAMYKDEFDSNTLPKLEIGTVLECDAPEIQKTTTKPPPLHNDRTILQLMETAGKELEDEEQREAIKSAGGLGTPSTRAEMLEKLISIKYITRSKQALIPTEKGLTAADILKNVCYLDSIVNM